MRKELVNKYELIERLKGTINENTLIVCIGTPKVYWDKTSCIVGTLLTEKYNIKNVLGTYDDPVHALNLEERIKNIKHNNILAIDSCVAADNKKVGDILFVNALFILHAISIAIFLIIFSSFTEPYFL